MAWVVMGFGGGFRASTGVGVLRNLGLMDASSLVYDFLALEL